MVCELCEILKNQKKDKVYFETEEIIIIEVNEHLVTGMMKKHGMAVEDGKASGLIKAMMKGISKNKPNSTYTFKKEENCKDHFGIHATIKTNQ